jgi:hypothetical protein
MYILTHTAPLENCTENTFRVQDTALEQEYLNAGYRRYERSYKIKEQHKEYTIICPEFRNDTKGLKPIVVIPEFLVPGRPYPLYVYLYAINLYSSAPEKGQRWAAESTRKYFRLETFAHTTLGRALKALTQVICGGPKENGTQTPDEEKKPEFPGTKSTEKLRKAAVDFLHDIPTKAVRSQIIFQCCRLAGDWFARYQRLLL